MLAKSLYPNWNQVDELTDYRPILRYFDRRYHKLAIISSDELDGFCFAAYGTQRIGILEFRFGCCRNCDRLNAVRSYEELDYLIVQIERSIEWINRYELCAGLMKIRSRLLLPQQLQLFESLVDKLVNKL